ncbi:hypothetical protein D3C85_1278500 [compost metagenome]
MCALQLAARQRDVLADGAGARQNGVGADGGIAAQCAGDVQAAALHIRVAAQLADHAQHAAGHARRAGVGAAVRVHFQLAGASLHEDATARQLAGVAGVGCLVKA